MTEYAKQCQRAYEDLDQRLDKMVAEGINPESPQFRELANRLDDIEHEWLREIDRYEEGCNRV